MGEKIKGCVKYMGVRESYGEEKQMREGHGNIKLFCGHFKL